MDRLTNSGRVALLLVVVMLAVALIGQAATDALVPVTEKSATGQSIERAGFAYLTGVRTYAAAVLWNRLDGLFHEYYGETSLDEQTYMMPTLNMAVMLDPQLTQPYYVAAWVLARRGEVDEGLALAARGVENNPQSGLLRVNHAQLLALFTDDEAATVAEANAVLGEDIVWTGLGEQHDGYASVHAILQNAGEDERVTYVELRLAEIDEEMEHLGIHDEHDHDHDH
jgi:hypothetical protein